MKKIRLNIPTLNFLTSTIIAVTLVLLLSLFWYKSRMTNLEVDFLSYRDQLFEISKDTVKSLVDSALRLIDTGKREINTANEALLKSQTASLKNNFIEKPGISSTDKVIENIKNFNTSEQKSFPFIIDIKNNILILPQDLSRDSYIPDYLSSADKRTLLINKSRNTPDGIFFNDSSDNNLSTRIVNNFGYAVFNPAHQLLIGTCWRKQLIENEAQKRVLNYVSDIGLAEDDYIFVLTPEGKMMAHFNPERINKNLYDYTDKNGVKVVQELIQAANGAKFGGFIEYTWRRPSTNAIAKKIGYARKLQGLDWIIGSGLYLANFDAMLEEQRRNMQHYLNAELETMLLLLLGAIAAITVISSIIAFIVKKNIRTFISSLQSSLTKHYSIDDHTHFIQEFNEISGSTNSIIADLIQKENELNSFNQSLEDKVARRTHELQIKTKQLEKSSKLANAANESKSIFLANMSHEIRTPMNIILGMQQLLLNSKVNKTQKNYLKKANQAAQSLLGIINDILDFSKIEAGQMNIDSVEFNIEETISNVLSFLTFEAAQKNLEIILDYDTKIPEIIIGDPLRLRQVFSNLCNNAIKFSAEGSIVVLAHLLHITGDTIEIQFEVRDNGIGIDKDKQDIIFEPFKQADSTITREFGGTGLGLIICKQLIELQGGHINLNSIPSIGTTISFTLPFTTRATRPLVETSNHKNRDKRILILDKNYLTLKILKRYAEDYGFTADTAGTLQESCELIAKQEEYFSSYHTIMINSTLTGNHGIETFIYINKHFSLADTNFIYMTCQSTMDLIRSTKELGFTKVITKPITPSMLQHILNDPKDTTYFPPTRIDDSYPDFRLDNTSILLVEDNPINREIVENLLLNAGCKVTAAINGEIAVNKAKAEKFNLILMDIQMPVLDGLEATRRIRIFDQTTPIIAMTAHALSEDYTKSIESGMNDHLTKPIKFDDLFKTISKFITQTTAYDTESELQADISNSAEDHPNNNDNSNNNIAEEADPVWRKLATLPAINLREALSNVGGNKELLSNIYMDYIQVGTDTLKKLDYAIKANEYEEIIRLAHTIKGSAATIGATRLSNCAEKIETILNNNIDTDISSEYSELTSVFKNFLTSLNNIFKNFKN